MSHSTHHPDLRFYSRVMNQYIESPLHGVSRSIERSITEEEIQAALDDPSAQVIPQTNRRFRLSSTGLTIILEYSSGRFRMVTVYRNRSKKGGV